jgi:hypothetical protein
MKLETAIFDTRSLPARKPFSPSTGFAEGEIARINQLFNEAVRTGWNSEIDWLWLATQVAFFSQQQYCLEQALRINPQSILAKKGLKQLTRHPDQPLKF